MTDSAGDSVRPPISAWTGAAVLFFCLLSLACSSRSEPAPAGHNGEPEDGCVPGEHYTYFQLPFEMDYRSSGTLAFSLTCDDLQGILTLNETPGFLRAGVPYPASGKRRLLPETGYLLYTFGIPVREITEPDCPEGSATVWLSLSAQSDSHWLSGAAAVYCGLPQAPATARHVRLLRISGQVEETDGGK